MGEVISFFLPLLENLQSAPKLPRLRQKQCAAVNTNLKQTLGKQLIVCQLPIYPFHLWPINPPPQVLSLVLSAISICCHGQKTQIFSRILVYFRFIPHVHHPRQRLHRWLPVDEAPGGTGAEGKGAEDRRENKGPHWLLLILRPWRSQLVEFVIACKVVRQT